jgi:hypothetical protein
MQRMTDYTPKKSGEGTDVNMDTSGLAAWDHAPGDRDPRWYKGRGTDEQTVLGEVNQPRSYTRLSKGEKDALQGWVARELAPAPLTGPKCSYALKHIYERLTRHYVTNGAWNGAMLAAGYEPIDRTELNWQFRFAFADPDLAAKSIGRVGRVRGKAA